MRRIIMFFCLVVLVGCQTAPKTQSSSGDLQSVLKEVKKSFNVQDVRVKYCPKCGKHYSGHLEKCAVDNTQLLPVE